MNKAFIVVFDTNILVSAAILKNSVPATCFDISLAKYTVIYSLQTLLEVTEVMSRRKFDRYLSAEDKL